MTIHTKLLTFKLKLNRRIIYHCHMDFSFIYYYYYFLEKYLQGEKHLFKPSSWQTEQN